MWELKPAVPLVLLNATFIERGKLKKKKTNNIDVIFVEFCFQSCCLFGRSCLLSDTMINFFILIFFIFKNAQNVVVQNRCKINI